MKCHDFRMPGVEVALNSDVCTLQTLVARQRIAASVIGGDADVAAAAA
jgi:hypothetical protein